MDGMSLGTGILFRAHTSIASCTSYSVDCCQSNVGILTAAVPMATALPSV